MSGIRFQLNGRWRTENGISPTMTLLDYLRLNAHLTGTKEGCAEGDCGACTVVVGLPQDDGRMAYRAVNSCLVLVPQVDGLPVITVEGLAQPDGTLHSVQQALVEADATQCGFCTPGFAMAMFAFAHESEILAARRATTRPSTRRWPAISAAAPAIGRSWKPAAPCEPIRRAADFADKAGKACIRISAPARSFISRRKASTNWSKRKRNIPTPSCLAAAPISASAFRKSARRFQS